MSQNLKIALLVGIGGLLTSGRVVLSDPMPAAAPQVEVQAVPEIPPVKAELLRQRNGLKNTFAKLRAEQPVTIAYFGGSITAGAGASSEASSYRARVTQWFRDNFPKSQITEVNAAIGGTGSDLGAFRMERDVLSHKPDLIFIEFAVNDGGIAPPKILQTMEGIFRQAWNANSDTDLCLIYTYHAGQQNELAKGFFPEAAATHDFLAEKYGVPAISVALPIAELVRDGKMLPQPSLGADDKPLPVLEGVALFSNDGVHPKDEAMGMYAKTITDSMATLEAAGKPGPHVIPAPVLSNNYEHAGLFPLQKTMLSSGWKPLGDENDSAKQFKNFLPQIWQGSAGETLKFNFKGTTAKLFDLVGPDGGQVYVTIDGVRNPTPFPRFDSYCTYHRLQTLTLCENLPDTTHTVSLEIDSAQPDRAPALKSEPNPAQVDPNKYNGTFVRIGWLMIDGALQN